MELGESLEDTACREVYEETGYTVEVDKLRLLAVFSGEEYYSKVSNGDEFYSVTVVYVTDEYEGSLKIDYTESKDMKFFNVHDIPRNINKEYKDFLDVYIKSMMNTLLVLMMKESYLKLII